MKGGWILDDCRMREKKKVRAICIILDIFFVHIPFASKYLSIIRRNHVCRFV